METVPIVSSILIILAAPWLAEKISFAFVDNIVFRLLLVAAILYAVRRCKGQLEGLLALLAVFTLIIERNHQVLMKFPEQTPSFPSKVSYVEANPLTQTQPVHNSPESEPEHEEGVRDIHDNIPRLSEAPNSHDAPKFFKGY